MSAISISLPNQTDIAIIGAEPHAKKRSSASCRFLVFDFRNKYWAQTSERGNIRRKFHNLLYVQRRFIHKEQLRHAITQVVNAIFRSRLPHIWGKGTTAENLFISVKPQQ